MGKFLPLFRLKVFSPNWQLCNAKSTPRKELSKDGFNNYGLNVFLSSIQTIIELFKLGICLISIDRIIIIITVYHVANCFIYLSGDKIKYSNIIAIKLDDGQNVE